MKNQNDEINYHIWNGPNIKGKTYTEVQLPDGSVLHSQIGEIEIQKGDAVWLDYGRSMGVYTRSGRGYESEFKYGRIVLHGCPVGVELEPGQAQNATHTTSTRKEFENIIEKQKERIAPQVEELKDIFIMHEVKRRIEAKAANEAAEVRRKERLSNALNQMEAFFNSPRPKP